MHVHMKTSKFSWIYYYIIHMPQNNMINLNILIHVKKNLINFLYISIKSHFSFVTVCSLFFILHLGHNREINVNYL